MKRMNGIIGYWLELHCRLSDRNGIWAKKTVPIVSKLQINVKVNSDLNHCNIYTTHFAFSVL